jgi:hypothetical protein
LLAVSLTSPRLSIGLPVSLPFFLLYCVLLEYAKGGRRAEEEAGARPEGSTSPRFLSFRAARLGNAEKTTGVPTPIHAS